MNAVAELLRLLRRPVVLLALVLVLLVQVYLNTYGTWHFFEKEVYGGAYDSLADSLMHADTEIPLDEIYMEGIRSGGKISMYFGPFPAFPRIIAHILAPSFWGKWSRLSVLGASLVALCSFLVLWLRVAGKAVPKDQHAPWIACLVVGFGLGTPVIFLLSCSYIFHEAVSWGLAWSLFALAAAAALENERPNYTNKNILLFAWGTGMAFLARVTFGVPLLAVAGALAVDAIIARRQAAGDSSLRNSFRYWRAALPCILPVLCCLVFYLWYNYDRFGSPFIFGSIRHAFPDDYTIQIVERTGTFNVGRIPTAMENFFGPPGNNLLPAPPYFQLAIPRVFVPELYPYRYQREGMATLVLTAPWLLVGSVLGVYALFFRRRVMPFVTAAALFGEILLVCAVRHLSHRFIAECLPLLLYLFSYGIWLLYDARVTRTVRAAVISVLLCSGLLAVAANFGTTVAWNAWDNWAGPVRWRKLLTEQYVLATPPRKPLDSCSVAPP